MCFFHVLMNANKQMNGFPAYVKASIMKDIYDIHFENGEGEAILLCEAVLRTWMTYACVVDFARYVRTQWLYGAFCNWQVLRTASGFASTNNPVELFNRVLKRDYTLNRQLSNKLFNRVLKRDYTLNRRLKIGMLLRELSNCCQNESSNGKCFRRQLEPQQALVRRTTKLSRENLLHLGLEPKSCADPVTGIPRYAVLHVVSIPAPRIKLPELGKTQEALGISSQMGANCARMEHQDTP
ncbi:hypothetical protein PHMEG_0005231 [Phytophthora megakarya]|uniref:MULE transposase domain-containing protein n=1 Tax=Phytophthora megakarya TaxID=4795 RepID=A0A225WTD8_9STRA|nr:hypothetical protein PHMEG_0005231 [Phytophthora megakarya]